MSKYAVSTVFKSIDKMTAPVKKMQSAVGKFTTSAENGMRKLDGALNGVRSTMISGVSTAAKWGAGIAAAAIVGVGAINQQQQEIENLTNAVNGSINTVEAVTSAISTSGLSAENVIDLYEEMNNKLGESAGLEEITAVTESLGILGLRFKDIKKLAPEEQFKAITNAALKMEDATKAQAAADILMGGEANKVIGILRKQGKTMDDIIGNYEELSFRTEKSRQGARDMAREQSKLGKVIGSLGKEVSGLAGQHLAPLISKVNEFLIANKAVIGQSIDEFFAKLTSSVGDVNGMMQSAITWVQSLNAKFEDVQRWAGTVAKVTAAVVGLMVVLKLFIGIMTAVNLVMAANPATLIVMGIVAAVAALAAAAYAIYDNWDDIVTWFMNKWNDIKTALGWDPVEVVSSAWSGLTVFFGGLFSGITDMYNNTVGKVMSAIESTKSFLGFGDSDVNVNKNISTESVISPQERQAAYYGRMQGSVDVNVYGHNGVRPEQPTYTSRLSLANSGN